MQNSILNYLYYKSKIAVFLKNIIKKKLPQHSKLYILLLFLTSRQIEYLKILIKLIYIAIFNKNKKIIIRINNRKIYFTANNFYTTSYFLYDTIIPEKPVLIFLYNYFKKQEGVFFDIGGFVGLHSFITKISNSKTEIHIFEADKYKCKILKKNIQKNNFKKIYLNEKFVTTSNSNRNPNDFTKYTNNEISINDYMSKKNISDIDILKMDIEGFEYFALENINFKKIKVLLIEFHSRIIKEELKREPYQIIKKLKKYNLNIFFLDHKNNDNIKILKLTRKNLENDNCMLICTKIKLKTLRKYFNEKVDIKKIN